MSAIDNMTEEEIDVLAARQLADYRRHTPGAVFAEGLQLSGTDAYRLQTRVVRLREGDGETVVGYKVGCTSREIQQQLGIDQPVFGRLFATERHVSEALLSIADYDALAIEGELAVQLADDIADVQPINGNLIRSIGAVFPVIELHNYVFHSGAPSPTELIANNGMHAGFVVPANIHQCTPSVDPQLSIAIDGHPIAQRQDQATLAAITQSLRWLVAELSRHGEVLHAGQIVLTGSYAPLIRVRGEASITVNAPPYGDVRARVLSGPNQSTSRQLSE